MLEWAHRTGVDVEVGVELLHGHVKTAMFKQGAQGCRRKAFTEGGYDAASDKDVFHVLECVGVGWSGLEWVVFC